MGSTGLACCSCTNHAAPQAYGNLLCLSKCTAGLTAVGAERSPPFPASAGVTTGSLGLVCISGAAMGHEMHASHHRIIQVFKLRQGCRARQHMPDLHHLKRHACRCHAGLLHARSLLLQASPPARGQVQDGAPAPDALQTGAHVQSRRSTWGMSALLWVWDSQLTTGAYWKTHAGCYC